MDTDKGKHLLWIRYMLYIVKLYWRGYMPYLATRHFWKGEYSGKICLSKSVLLLNFREKNRLLFLYRKYLFSAYFAWLTSNFVKKWGTDLKKPVPHFWPRKDRHNNGRGFMVIPHTFEPDNRTTFKFLRTSGFILPEYVWFLRSKDCRLLRMQNAAVGFLWFW